MNLPELKTPVEWLQDSKWKGVEILDPDGWRTPFSPDFNEPLPYDEFVCRLSESTCKFPAGFFE